MAHELPKTIPTVLISAAHILQNRGWCRGKLIDEDGALCLLSAIFVASTGQPASSFYGQDDHDELTRAAWGVVEDLINARYGQIGQGMLTIPGWNDQPSRTIEDVYQVLDDAAMVAAFA